MFKKVLVYGASTTAVIAVVSSVVGYLLGGLNGLLSALVGALTALTFTSLTSITVWLGGKLNLGGFYAVVMGAWVLKMVLFIASVALLHNQPWVNGPVVFFTVVTSVVASLVIDAVVFMKARLPIAG